MAERISVYAAEPIARALAAIAEGAPDGANRSGRLNTVCERFLGMVADEVRRLDFSRAEWCAILDANNGTYLGMGDRSEMARSMLWANVADSGHQLGAKWKIDEGALAGRLREAPHSTAIAILEVVERFWSRAEMPTDEALAASGVSIPDAGAA